MKKNGFTLLELLISLSVLAIVSVMLGSVLSHSRKIARAAESSAEHFRAGWALKETMQAELDISPAAWSVETSAERPVGISFVTYTRVQGRRIRARVRYLFEPDEEKRLFRFVRHEVAEGIGRQEMTESLLDGVADFTIESYSEAAASFIPVEEMTGTPAILRLNLKRVNGAAPPNPAAGAVERAADDTSALRAPSEDILILLRHAATAAVEL